MSLNCPICRKHFPAHTLRHQLVCSQCGNPLLAKLTAATWTFLSLAVIFNGFIALVWLALTGPASIPDALRGALILIIPWGFVSWGLFLWTFSTLTHLSLDLDQLPNGRPICRPSTRHYHREATAS